VSPPQGAAASPPTQQSPAAPPRRQRPAACDLGPLPPLRRACRCTHETNRISLVPRAAHRTLAPRAAGSQRRRRRRRRWRFAAAAAAGAVWWLAGSRGGLGLCSGCAASTASQSRGGATCGRRTAVAPSW
jgi:hypothetical protein